MSKNELNDPFNIFIKNGDVTKTIVEFSNSPEFRELNMFYRRKSNFEILGIQRNERRHSRFLAWLLDPSGAHDLGTFSLKKFLEVCVISRLESKQHIPRSEDPLSGLLDKLIVGAAEIKEATVKTEMSLGKQGYIDIHVECSVACPGEKEKKLVILIENKVSSTEHDKQTVRYSEWLHEHSSGYDYSLLVYLTPIPTLKLIGYEKPDCECKDFLQINYQ